MTFRSSLVSAAAVTAFRSTRAEPSPRLEEQSKADAMELPAAAQIGLAPT